MAFALWLVLSLSSLSGCSQTEDVALGTLEWDRIALPAPVAEKIVAIHVVEGQRVVQGQILLQLDPAQTRARLHAAEAAVARQAAALAELEVGPRQEEIERARAALAAAEADAVDKVADYRRLSALGDKNYVSRSEIDAALAAADSARAQVRAAREQLLELERGNRPEDIEQGKAALLQAQGEAQALRVLLEKLTLRAPRGGIVDSIPFKLGDESPVGASLVVMLTGNTPYARVYVPQPIRHKLHVGSVARVTLTGVGGDSLGTFVGRVRMVRNDPSFTPYYALTGDDVARLSYIAEIQLREDAAPLPAGLPLRAAFLSTDVDSAPPAPPPLGGQIEPGDEAAGGDGAEDTVDPSTLSAPTEQRRASDHEASFDGGK
ncbi:HlyD family secretion protein [Microbulbifer harenosus]|uniref:Biotin/lipoyl-binding protein n=1 Tax=Microbulbifer harenosus TaxID=2576840 RepID=A0ABY2UQ07_9GAMM|nr:MULTISPECIES: biotin/lipoyl-binding protein [Microbulbifer]QIL90027.1 biotin/lipoyl-binding protein [Microbulbifer sp. SH-1]TLM79836.1 biotin/lipoyl-binding protein [Microbulbifer harenosus]